MGKKRKKKNKKKKERKLDLAEFLEEDTPEPPKSQNPYIDASPEWADVLELYKRWGVGLGETRFVEPVLEPQDPNEVMNQAIERYRKKFAPSWKNTLKLYEEYNVSLTPFSEPFRLDTTAVQNEIKINKQKETSLDSEFFEKQEPKEDEDEESDLEQLHQPYTPLKSEQNTSYNTPHSNLTENLDYEEDFSDDDDYDDYYEEQGKQGKYFHAGAKFQALESKYGNRLALDVFHDPTLKNVGNAETNQIKHQTRLLEKDRKRKKRRRTRKSRYCT